MNALSIPFDICAADIDESNAYDETPPDLVVRLSLEKARAVAARFPDAVVIGADTIVTLDGALLGKPADESDAVAMLRRLRDRPHQVYSGISVCRPGNDPLIDVVESTVWMRPYTEAEIAAYVASGDPLDKAGAYGIQNDAFRPVACLRGCYASVMGLPLCALARLLTSMGMHLPVDARTACLAVADGPRPPGETGEPGLGCRCDDGPRGESESI